MSASSFGVSALSLVCCVAAWGHRVTQDLQGLGTLGQTSELFGACACRSRYPHYLRAFVLSTGRSSRSRIVCRCRSLAPTRRKRDVSTAPLASVVLAYRPVLRSLVPSCGGSRKDDNKASLEAVRLCIQRRHARIHQWGRRFSSTDKASCLTCASVTDHLSLMVRGESAVHNQSILLVE